MSTEDFNSTINLSFEILEHMYQIVITVLKLYIKSFTTIFIVIQNVILKKLHTHTLPTYLPTYPQ
jgi:hypothetical protein